MPIPKSPVRLPLCSFIQIFSKGKCSKITIWDKRCIMLYWILEKKPIQVDSKALGQKPLEWANRCIIDGNGLKVTKKKQLITSPDLILHICPINVDLLFWFCPYMIWQRVSIDMLRPGEKWDFYFQLFFWCNDVMNVHMMHLWNDVWERIKTKIG